MKNRLSGCENHGWVKRWITATAIVIYVLYLHVHVVKLISLAMKSKCFLLFLIFHSVGLCHSFYSNNVVYDCIGIAISILFLTTVQAAISTTIFCSFQVC